MNRTELATILQAENFRRDAYDLGDGSSDERYCLKHSRGIWSVYYSERGLQSGKREFATEDEACEHLLQVLRNDPSARA